MLKDMQSGQKEILKEISHLKVAVEEVKGDIKTLEAEVKGDIKSLSTKIEQLDKRIANQEFTPIRGQANRRVLVGLILVILGGAVKLFELGKF